VLKLKAVKWADGFGTLDGGNQWIQFTFITTNHLPISTLINLSNQMLVDGKCRLCKQATSQIRLKTSSYKNVQILKRVSHINVESLEAIKALAMVCMYVCMD